MHGSRSENDLQDNYNLIFFGRQLMEVQTNNFTILWPANILMMKWKIYSAVTFNSWVFLASLFTHLYQPFQPFQLSWKIRYLLDNLSKRFAEASWF